MTFAEKIRQLREKVGITEIELARQSGLAYGTLHHYVLGMRLPSFAAVVRIADALGVDCRVFAECEDIMEQSRPRLVPEVEQKPRRPRGRPPKQPPEAPEESPVKRRRGRPKK